MTTCALVATSDFNADEFLARYERGEYDSVWAVDGGYAHLEAIGVKPDLAIGDFDSLGYVPTGLAVIKYSPRKSMSDLELAFDEVRGRFTDVTCFGVLGQRLDHTLGALYVMAAAAGCGIAVRAVGMDMEVVFVHGPGSLDLPARESGIVSVFPMKNICTGVTETGLVYPLRDGLLMNSNSLGLSNEFKGEPARIEVEEGTIAVFISLGPSAETS